MTHFSKYDAHGEIKWEDTFIDRYDNNNGIVLKHKNTPRGSLGDVIAYIDGADVGVTWDDQSDLPVQRATPIFKAILVGYNRAYRAAHEHGANTARRQMREALGL